MTNSIYFLTAIFAACVTSRNGRLTPYVTFDDVSYDKDFGLVESKNWTMTGEVVLPDIDKTMFRSELVLQAIMPICRINLHTCSSDKRAPGACYCAAKSGNTYRVHVGAQVNTELRGRQIEAILPGRDLYPGLTISKIIGEIPNISESPEVKITYHVNSGEVLPLLTTQTLHVCGNTLTSIKVCVPNRPRGSVLQIDDVDAVYTAKDSCITWTNTGIDFTTLTGLTLTLTYQASRGCSHSSFLIHIKEMETPESCLPATTKIPVSTLTTGTTPTIITTTVETTPTSTTAVDTTPTSTTTVETTPTSTTAVESTPTTTTTTGKAISTTKTTTVETTSTTPKTTPGYTNHVATMSQNQIDSYCARTTVLPNGLSVVCDHVDGHNWILIQRKVSNSVDFFRNWAQYTNGFGDSSNFWIGLKYMNELCNQDSPCQLRFDMVYTGKPDNVPYRPDHKYYAKFDKFYISNATDNFRLFINGYSGTAGHRFVHVNNGMAFSTVDKGNDLTSTKSCAQQHHSGWWFGFCTQNNPNGFIRPANARPNSKSATWWSITLYHSLQAVEMKVRPRT